MERNLPSWHGGCVGMTSCTNDVTEGLRSKPLPEIDGAPLTGALKHHSPSTRVLSAAPENDNIKGDFYGLMDGRVKMCLTVKVKIPLYLKYCHKLVAVEGGGGRNRWRFWFNIVLTIRHGRWRLGDCVGGFGCR